MIRSTAALLVTAWITSCQTVPGPLAPRGNEAFRGPNTAQTIPMSLGSYMFRFEATPDFRVNRVGTGIEVWGSRIRPVVVKPQTDAEREKGRYEFHVNGRFYRFSRVDEPRKKVRPGQSQFRVVRPDIYVFRPSKVHQIQEEGIEVTWRNPGLDLFFLERMPRATKDGVVQPASTRWYIGSAIVERAESGEVRYWATPDSDPKTLRQPATLELDRMGQIVEPSS